MAALQCMSCYQVVRITLSAPTALYVAFLSIFKFWACVKPV
jgi:hypothetical protein